VIAPDARWLARVAKLNHHYVDPAPGKVDGEGEADRASACDQHLGFGCVIHCVPPPELDAMLIAP
jgi:hypothetical protein